MTRYLHAYSWKLNEAPQDVLDAVVKGLTQRLPDYAFLEDSETLLMYTFEAGLAEPDGWQNTVDRVTRILRNNKLIGE